MSKHVNALIIGVLIGIILSTTSAHAGFWQTFAMAMTGEENNEIAEEWEGPELFTDEHSAVFSDLCVNCHQTEASASSENLRDDAAKGCVECHAVNRLQSHPVNITPIMGISSDFPLSSDGKMNCITCHNPHSGASNFLRGGDYQADALEDFCQNCHYYSTAQPHAGTIGVVHQKHETPRITSVQIDYISKKCLDCHDGKKAPTVPINMTGDGSFMWAGPGGGSHKIGRNYQEALTTSGRKLGLRQDQDLPEDISFYEGKMGCLSCHNLYSLYSHKTTVSINESALCLACHDR